MRPRLGRQHCLIAGSSSANLLCSLQGHRLRLPAARSGFGCVHKTVLCACCWGCLCCRHAPLHAWQQPLCQIVRPVVLPWSLLHVPAKDCSHCAVPCWCNCSQPGSLAQGKDCSYPSERCNKTWVAAATLHISWLRIVCVAEFDRDIPLHGEDAARQVGIGFAMSCKVIHEQEIGQSF